MLGQDTDLLLNNSFLKFRDYCHKKIYILKGTKTYRNDRCLKKICLKISVQVLTILLVIEEVERFLVDRGM